MKINSRMLYAIPEESFGSEQTSTVTPAWQAGALFNCEHLIFEQGVNGEERFFLLFSIQ